MLVSIIIPVYQVSDYIERCLLSVMKQDYYEIECIIVDDATKDDSILKCEKLIENYSGPIQFKIIHHPTNLGVSATRNTGTNAATGEYLYYIDSDDEITPDCIGKLMAPIIEDKTIDMVQGNYIQDENGKLINKGISPNAPLKISSNDDVRKQSLDYYTINDYSWNKLLKRSFILKHNLYFKEKIVFEDQLWRFYLLKYLENVYICNDITYYYHTRPKSLLTETKNTKEKGNSFQIIFDEIFNHLTVGKEWQELNGVYNNFFFQYLTYVDDIPSFIQTLYLYRNFAKRYGCVYIYIALTILGKYGHFRIPRGVLKRFNRIRNKRNRFHGHL
jgi:glycosyltransferase involved in cell wall biosynthesis